MLRLNKRQRTSRTLQDSKFCESQEVINRLRKSLKICEIQNYDLDGKLYLDELSGQKWEVYEYDDMESYIEPYPKGMRQFPYPSLSEIIDIVCNSSYEDEVQGACRLLSENEASGEEFREILLDEIEKRQIHHIKKRYDLIYEAAHLEEKVNHRETMNVKYSIVKADYEYYLRLADRALKLKR